METPPSAIPNDTQSEVVKGNPPVLRIIATCKHCKIPNEIPISEENFALQCYSCGVVTKVNIPQYQKMKEGFISQLASYQQSSPRSSSYASNETNSSRNTEDRPSSQYSYVFTNSKTNTNTEQTSSSESGNDARPKAPKQGRTIKTLDS